MYYKMSFNAWRNQTKLIVEGNNNLEDDADLNANAITNALRGNARVETPLDDDLYSECTDRYEEITETPVLIKEGIKLIISQ